MRDLRDLAAAGPWTDLRYVAVDVEGNGQQPPDLVEIALVPIESGAVGAPKSWLVRPHQSITPMARSIHGISNDDVRTAPEVGDIAKEIVDLLEGAVFVAHHAHVDLDVVTRELPGFQPALVLDTLKLARRLLPGRPSYRLGALVAEFDLAKGLPADLSPHRATYDACICARLLTHMASPPSAPVLTAADLFTSELRPSKKGRPNDQAEALF